jgi:general secretion pathway protein D
MLFPSARLPALLRLALAGLCLCLAQPAGAGRKKIPRVRPVLAASAVAVNAAPMPATPARAGAAQHPAAPAGLATLIDLDIRDRPLDLLLADLGRLSGLNFILDRDVIGTTPVSARVRQVGLDELLHLLLASNQLASQPVGTGSFLIYPNTPAKQREYEPRVSKAIALRNSDLKQAQSLLRSLAGITDILADEARNTLVLRASPAAVELGERLLQALDQAAPEVEIEIELVEIDRSSLLDLGPRWPDSAGYGLLAPSLTSTTVSNGLTSLGVTAGGSLAPGYVDLQHGLGVPFLANPAFKLHLLAKEGRATLLATPRLRARSREKAHLHVGDKIPTFTTTASANVGVSAAVNYLETGLKVEVEPVVRPGGEVDIAFTLEQSSVVGEASGPNDSLAYQLRTRSASTRFRLADGETQVLAGLLDRKARKTLNAVPGLGDVPLLGEAFRQRNTDDNEVELVVLVTPRIVRALQPAPQPADGLPANTAAEPGGHRLSLRPRPGGSLALVSGTRSQQAANRQEFALRAPDNADIGISFTAGIVIDGYPGANSGQIEIAYDKSKLQAAGGGDGRVAVPLARLEDGSLRGSQTFVVIAEQVGETTLRIVSANVEDDAGKIGHPAPPPAHSLKIRP